MRIRIVSRGTLGDIQPFITLAVRLRDEGNDVAFVTQVEHKAAIEAHGLSVRSIDTVPEASKALLNGVEALAQSPVPLSNLREKFDLIRRVQQASRSFVPLAMDLCSDAELIVCATVIFFTGETIAALLRVPVVFVSVCPLSPSCFYTNIYMPCISLRFPSRVRKAYNWATHYLVLQAGWLFQRSFYNRLRKERGGAAPLPWLPSLTRRFLKGPVILNAYSRLLLKPSDWDAHNPVIGFIQAEADKTWQASPELLRFLSAGTKPLLVTFGSMSSQCDEALIRTIVLGLQGAQLRAVFIGRLSNDWIGLKNLFVANYIPYDFLLPHTTAAFYHGGAGTVGAVLKAGIPSVIMPFINDQHFWARQLFGLGVARQPLMKRGLTSDTVGACLTNLINDREMRQRARTLAAQISDEDGLSAAMAMIRTCAIKTV